MMEVAPFTISRVFDAPRSLVWKCQTEAEHLMNWYAPAGMTVLKAAMDLRPGGTYHYGLKMPDGKEMWGKQTFREVVPQEKLVFIQTFSDPQGGITRHPMSPTWPLEMLATTTFEDVEGGKKTKLTVSWKPYNPDDEAVKTFDGAREGMTGGFKGTFDMLDAYLAKISPR